MYDFIKHAKSEPETDKPVEKTSVQQSLMDLMRTRLEIDPDIHTTSAYSQPPKQKENPIAKLIDNKRSTDANHNVNNADFVSTAIKESTVNNADFVSTAIKESTVNNADFVSTAIKESTVNTVDFVYIDTQEKFEEEIASLQNVEVLGVDTETTGLRPELGDRIRLIQIAAANHPVYLIDCFKFTPSPQELEELFNSKTLIFHNASFDLKFLLEMGIKVTGTIFDTMIAEHLLNLKAKDDGTSDTPKSLKAITKKYLGIELDKQEQKGEWGAGNLSPSQLQYAAKDAKILLDLRDKLKPLLVEKGLADVAKIEFTCTQATAIMELNGLGVDVNGWRDYIKATAPKLEELKAEIIGILPPVPAPAKTSKRINSNQVDLFSQEVKYKEPKLNSNPYLKEAFELAGYEIPMAKDKKTGVLKPSFAHDVLKRYALKHPDLIVISKLLAYKKIDKLLSSFGQSMLNQVKESRLYPSLRQDGTVTGRYSCTSPNIQQFPREVRGFIIPSPGNKFIQADYSQMELRAAASVFGEQEMIKAFEGGADIHTLTASLIFGGDVTKEQRSIAKQVNFGILYGMGAEALALKLQSLDIKTSKNEAQKFLSAILKGYPAINSYIQKHKNTQAGAKVITSSGREITLNRKAPQQIKNFPIQSICADANKLALSRLVRELPDYCKLVASIHDEVLIEVPTNYADPELLELVSKIMVESAKRFLPDVPVVCDAQFIDNWGEK
jgi:DNA polymerase I-like protein with 3'-5' exonuclease and polymerase domains